MMFVLSSNNMVGLVCEIIYCFIWKSGKTCVISTTLLFICRSTFFLSFSKLNSLESAESVEFVEHYF